MGTGRLAAAAAVLVRRRDAHDELPPRFRCHRWALGGAGRADRGDPRGVLRLGDSRSEPGVGDRAGRGDQPDRCGGDLDHPAGARAAAGGGDPGRGVAAQRRDRAGAAAHRDRGHRGGVLLRCGGGHVRVVGAGGGRGRRCGGVGESGGAAPGRRCDGEHRDFVHGAVRRVRPHRTARRVGARRRGGGRDRHRVPRAAHALGSAPALGLAELAHDRGGAGRNRLPHHGPASVGHRRRGAPRARRDRLGVAGRGGCAGAGSVGARGLRGAAAGRPGPPCAPQRRAATADPAVRRAARPPRGRGRARGPVDPRAPGAPGR
ncbi:Uncharacterised protein [Mycobacteroides abscessus subsp. abscessus]|nr:Uncharacterised protein [Mycobacteroides abscessus subsp. abscessus]